MRFKELRAQKTDELVKQVEEAHQELFNLRLRLSTRQLVNHRELSRVKKNIARLKTIIQETTINRLIIP